MNKKGFTSIEVVSTMIILTILVLIVVLVFMAFGKTGTIYEYTDLNNNVGTAYYCSSTYGSLYCSNGLDRIQVKEYHFIK